jgi:hypothetical protein
VKASIWSWECLRPYWWWVAEEKVINTMYRLDAMCDPLPLLGVRVSFVNSGQCQNYLHSVDIVKAQELWIGVVS